jgi:DNA-binding NarL/FixJ family response regulator
MAETVMDGCYQGPFGKIKGLGRNPVIVARHDALHNPGWHHRAMRLTLLIVDDHAGFRASARALLEAEGFDVIGEAADGAQALRAVAELQPEIVLLDIQLPGLDGIEVAGQLAEGADPPAVVLVSSREAAAYGPRLRESAVRGFIPKSALSGEALAALVS